MEAPATATELLETKQELELYLEEDPDNEQFRGLLAEVMEELAKLQPSDQNV
eukprot:SAG31_NODE_7513_length_1667_cov_1.089286_3_plen_52_part_00